MSSDGVIQSTIIIVTKKGETYQIISHDTKTEFTTKAIQRLIDKEPFVFPIQDQQGDAVDIILPYDTIYSMAVKSFSALQKIDRVKSSIK